MILGFAAVCHGTKISWSDNDDRDTSWIMRAPRLPRFCDIQRRIQSERMSQPCTQDCKCPCHHAPSRKTTHGASFESYEGCMPHCILRWTSPVPEDELYMSSAPRQGFQRHVATVAKFWHTLHQPKLAKQKPGPASSRVSRAVRTGDLSTLAKMCDKGEWEVDMCDFFDGTSLLLVS